MYHKFVFLAIKGFSENGLAEMKGSRIIWIEVFAKKIILNMEINLKI